MLHPYGIVGLFGVGYLVVGRVKKQTNVLLWLFVDAMFRIWSSLTSFTLFPKS